MGAPSRERTIEIAERRRRVADLYLQKHKQVDIAIRLGVSESVISKDLKIIQQEWAEQRVFALDQRKLLELESIDRTEREAWTAWDRSKGPIEISEATLDGSKAPDKGRARRVTKSTAGDPRFLLIVLRCIEQRCKILGLEAPTKTALTDSAGNDLQTPEAGRVEFDGILAALRERGRTAPPPAGAGGNGHSNRKPFADGLSEGSAN